MKTNSESNKKINAGQWFVLIVALLAIAGTWLMYSSKRAEIDYLISQNTVLQSKITSLEARKNTSTTTSSIKSAKNTSLEIFTPLANSVVSSPLYVTGKVPGNWSFEASFPIELQDNSGTVLAKTAAKVIGDWMTTEAVPFTATLTWEGTYRGPAKLILKKDNPSGLDEKSDYAEINLVIK